MTKIDEFKEFVKKNPSLLKSIKTGDMTWQKYYEMYDMYGEDKNVWNDYLGNKTKETTKEATVLTGNAMLDLLNMFKNIDLDSLQTGIGNVQRVLGFIQDLGKKDTPTDTKKTEYKPRPIYKHFED